MLSKIFCTSLIERPDPFAICSMESFISSRRFTVAIFSFDVPFSIQKMDVHAVTVVLPKELDVLIKKKTSSCFLIQHDKRQINLMLSLHLSVRVAETKNGHLDIIGNIL